MNRTLTINLTLKHTLAVIKRLIPSLLILSLTLPVFAQADGQHKDHASNKPDDYYLITATKTVQKEAQDIAALKGGWVLNTNFYTRLSPHLYAVVRGPFKTKPEADAQLATLTKNGNYPESYVKNAGQLTIEIKIGNESLSPHLLVALLGELRIELSDNKGASHPCEPQEPYQQLSLSYVSIAREYDKKTDAVKYSPQDVEIEVGAFRQIKASGEVTRMRVCAE